MDISISAKEQPAMEPPKDSQSKFAIFLNKDEFKDCELHASDGTAYKSHKIVLAATSPIFLEMFSADTPEAKTSVFKFEEIDSKTLKLLLHYCYCKEIDKKALEENASELLAAADKFQIKELMEICVQYLIEDLDEDNVLKVLPVATKLGCTSVVFNQCMDIFVR